VFFLFLLMSREGYARPVLLSVRVAYSLDQVIATRMVVF